MTIRQVGFALVGVALMCNRLLSADYYVGTAGRDTNPGTIQQPLQTFAAAQQLVRKSSALGHEPITVHFASGSYYLAEPIVFTSEDSGTAAAPVTYLATTGGATATAGAAVLSGGEKLDRLVWTAYQNNILKADVPADLKTDQLFVNGTRQVMARYPNFNPNERIFNGYAADAISDARAARWADPTGGFIHAMHRSEWGDFSYRITGKDANGKLTYEGGWQNNRQMGMHPRYRMVEEIFEELDAPGEWFLNQKTHTLYFYPPQGMSADDLAKANVETVRLRELVEFKGTEAASVKFVTLRGFTFRHTARTFMDNREPLLRSDWTIYRGGAVMFNGSEECGLENCFIDQVGGNAVFVNMYNRRVTIRGTQIANAGANGVAFVGDPNAVRSPLFEYNQVQNLDQIDRTPGPKTNNYPADCLVDDCLIYLSGRTEKQTAPIEISMSMGITVRHCSIYDVPRAGINIGEGTWGGHVIEFCDIFDTVKETGDHGSFNSWGRDRFWRPSQQEVNAWVAQVPELPFLDVVKPIILRNNRWRCDHGWDIDLDDGSSRYEIYNNLCLNGGIKNREGYGRLVENNIMVGFANGTFHPHVWFANSGDVFRRNIVFTAYKPIRVAKPWGKEVDFNLLHTPGQSKSAAAKSLQNLSGRDEHSIEADAMFIDPASGDYRVKDGSPALTLGFKNFPMDQFGVTDPELKKIAQTPSFEVSTAPPARGGPRVDDRQMTWLGATVKNVTTAGERSAAGLPEVAGVMVNAVPAGSAAEKAGLQPMDVILQCDGRPVRTFADIQRTISATQPAGATLQLGVMRMQNIVTIRITPSP